MKVAPLLFQTPLLLRDQLEAGEIDGFPPATQLLGNGIGVVTHKALVEHGSVGISAGSLWQGDSDHLSKHDGSHSRKERDA